MVYMVQLKTDLVDIRLDEFLDPLILLRLDLRHSQCRNNSRNYNRLVSSITAGFISSRPSLRPRTAPLRFPSVAMIDISALYPLLFGAFVLLLVRKRKRPTLPYPPGPNGYPLLGNVLDLTISVPLWEDITSLANRYGML